MAASLTASRNHRGRRDGRPRLAVAPVALTAALALAVGGCFGGEEEAGPPPADLRGSYQSPFRQGPPVPRARGTARRSTLTIGGSTYKLTSGIYGLLGEVRISDQTVEFRSPSGYFKLPGLTSAASTNPDPVNRCPGARGLYRWHRDGPRLRFTAVRDPCPGRKHQLQGETWTIT